MLQAGEFISFNAKKQFKYIMPLGSGGTGDTHLFEDETTDMLFAIKKYSPHNSEYIDEYYERFVDEIKILFQISHPNIVRIYNYYLYPEQKVGYLQMEYIEGVSIDKYDADSIPLDFWDNVFLDIITAFDYLEKNKILHRDIRPANVLISKDQKVKIIDFGFGKRLIGNEKDGKSIFLNWPASEYPEEVVVDGLYDHRSEIYFIGKLFQSVLKEDLDGFKYEHIIRKMIKISTSDRYSSFEEILKIISSGVLSELDFTDDQKLVYQEFAKITYNKVRKSK